MLKNKITLLINSCDKFSDLWDGHIKLLNENWNDRNIDTYIVTDAQSDKEYKNATIFSAGEGAELPQRLKAVLPHIKTDYVFITLDDYFLIKKVDNLAINSIIEEMKKNNLDYVRLFHLPRGREKLNSSVRLYRVDLYGSEYAVNLYAGIWKKDFLEKTIQKPLNAWQYEVSLTKIAREINANCAMTKGKEFKILDVVRKGKLLRKANKYFKKNPVYQGEREIMKFKDEFRIFCMTWIKELFPKCLVKKLKCIMKKKGHTFYSD